MTHLCKVCTAVLTSVLEDGDHRMRDMMLTHMTGRNMAHRAEASKAVLADAIIRGDTALCKELLSGVAATESLEERYLELGGDLLEESGNVVEIDNTNDSTAR